MNQQTISVIVTFASGGAMGTIIALFAAGRREKRHAIREFRRKLGTLRSEFERQPANHLFELYHNFVPKVQGDIAALRSDMCCGYQAIRKAGNAFAGIPRHEIEKPVAGGLGTEFETGRKRILEAIDALEKAI